MTVRYTLLLDDAANETISSLQQRYGLRSRAAVFDLATTLLEWASLQQDQGFVIGRSDSNGNFGEVLLPSIKVHTSEVAAAAAAAAATATPASTLEPGA